MEQQQQAGQTILVVEDEAILRLVVVEGLEDGGLVVREAGDGTQALAILEGDPSIALLISDIKMPGMNGLELAQASLSRRPDLKIILMTGYAQESLPDSLRHTNVRTIYKPFDLDKLCAMAAETLGIRSA
jgi:CheY-like chemotaxis protein